MGQRVTDRVLEEIRSRTDIVGLIGSRVTLKRAGSSFKACCPFHKEKTPSFHVNPVRQTYHCFGCGAHGDVFKFLMTQDGLGFMDAVRQLAEKAGVALDTEVDYAAEERNRLYAIHAELAAFYRRCLRQISQAEPARKYLESRKLGDDIAERFSIGYAPPDRDALVKWGGKHGYPPELLVAAGLLSAPNNEDRPDDYYDRFRGRLMFPIADAQGRVVAFSARILDKSHPAKYVNSPETPIFQKSRVLYALDKARQAIVKNPRREALVCEGQIDVIRCHSSGFDTAVASQGTAFTREHVELLKRYADSVLLVFDGDSAGRKAALRTGGLFLEQGLPVRIACLPPGHDPDSLIRDQGPDAFRERLDAAVSLVAFQVRVLREEERDPDAVDAVNRITRAVFETLALCPQAVLRSHLLHEAATLLHLPPEALSEDLETLRHQLASRPPPAPRAAPAPVAPPPARPATPRADLPSEVELRFCEMLVHHMLDPHGDAAELAGWIEQATPADLLRHVHAHALLDAWRQRRHGQPEAWDALMAADEESRQRFVTTLAGGHMRMEHARDATLRDAVEEMVARLWYERLDGERRQSAAGDQAQENRRLELTLILKDLQRPSTRRRRIEALAGVSRGPAAEATVQAPAQTSSPLPEAAPPPAPEHEHAAEEDVFA